MARRKEEGFEEKLNYWLPLCDNPTVLGFKGGEFFRAWDLVGPDLRYASEEERARLSTIQAQAFRLVSDNGWVLQAHRLCDEQTGYLPRTEFPDPTSALIDEEARRRYAQQGTHYEHAYALCITWKPQHEWMEKYSPLFYEGMDRGKEGRQGMLAEFIRVTDAMAAILESVVSLDPMDRDGVYTYLRTCVTGQAYRCHAPRGQVPWSHAMMDQEVWTGEEPKVGPLHVRTVAVEGFPAHSEPQMLEFYAELDFPFQASHRFIFVDKVTADAMLDAKRKKHANKREGAKGFLGRVFTGDSGHKKNIAAAIQADDAQVAQAENELGEAAYGIYTSCITLFHEDREEIERRAGKVQQLLQYRQFQTRLERMNAVEAWLGGCPGQVAENIRQVPIHALNLADLLPVTSIWSGQKTVTSPFFPKGSPVLLMGTTYGKSPFYLSPYYGDLANSLMIGPPGCHAKGTPILMNDGSLKNVEEIEVGDSVMGPDSQARVVQKLYRGTDEMVRIVPTKGEPFVVNKHHVLSLVRNHEGTTLSFRIVNISVKDWETQSRTYKEHHKLYRVGVHFPLVEFLPVDPYLLGVLLGDGTIQSTPVVTNPDPEIRQELARIAQRDGYILCDVHVGERCPAYTVRGSQKGVRYNTNPLTAVLRDLGMWGKTAEEKSIPAIYKVASWEDRLDLLAGLLDTDGNLSTGIFDYISKSKELAEDVVFLARSLGLAAYLTPSEKSWQGGTGLYYRVSISGHVDSIPCRVLRKQAGPRQQKKNVLVTGFTVESLGPGEYCGFECDKDHLYVLGDFTVTHNSGKTTSLNMWAASWLRYPNSRVRAFDAKYGMYALCRAVGGVHHDVGGADRVGVMPYARVEDEQERIWAHRFTMECLRLQNCPVSEKQSNEIWDTLTLMGTKPNGRSMTDFVYTLQDQQLRQGMRYYTKRGAGGDLFDCDSSQPLESRFIVFELMHLFRRGNVDLIPAVLYFFHEVERELTGPPTLITMDEGWKPLLESRLGEKVEEWERTFRDKNGILVFATQSVADIARSPIYAHLIDMCPTKVFMPNPEAETDIKKYYQGVGLNDKEIAGVRGGRPKSDALMKTPLGTAEYTMNLGRAALSFVGMSGVENVPKIKAIADAYGPVWPYYHLLERGCPEEAAWWMADYKRRQGEGANEYEACFSVSEHQPVSLGNNTVLQ